MTVILGFAACKVRLEELLAEAKHAVESAADVRARAVAANRYAGLLMDFTIDSQVPPPFDTAESEAIAKLDAAAVQASRDMSAIAIGGPVDAIVARQAEIAAITEKLKAKALTLADEDKKLRLIPLRDAIARMTDTVDAAKTLAKSLKGDQPDEAAIIAAVQALVDKFGDLRKAFDTARQG